MFSRTHTKDARMVILYPFIALALAGLSVLISHGSAVRDSLLMVFDIVTIMLAIFALVLNVVVQISSNAITRPVRALLGGIMYWVSDISFIIAFISNHGTLNVATLSSFSFVSLSLLCGIFWATRSLKSSSRLGDFSIKKGPNWPSRSGR